MSSYYLYEYKSEDGYYISNTPKIYISQKKMYDYISDKFNNSNIYQTHEEGTNDLFIKSTSDETRFFYVKKIN